MTSEDLFRAIGTVESSRLMRTELTATDNTSRENLEEETEMKKHTLLRSLRGLLIAAALISLLAVTAYAAVRTLGLKDQLAQWGMRDTQAVDKLSVIPEDTQNVSAEENQFAHATQYAGFTVEVGVV